MKRIMVHNPTGCPIYVGASMVPAGESRDFPEDQVPEHLRPQETVVTPEPEGGLLATAILEAAEKSLAGGEYHGREDYVVTGISGHFKADPEMVRTMLREAIAGLQADAELAQAEKLGELVAKPAKEVIAALPGLSNEDLGKLEKLDTRKTVLEAISALMLERAGGGQP